VSGLFLFNTESLFAEMRDNVLIRGGFKFSFGDEIKSEVILENFIFNDILFRVKILELF